jgi:Zinc finger, C3HC4 type (RING finger)
MEPHGLSLKNPPTVRPSLRNVFPAHPNFDLNADVQVYDSLVSFAAAHANKLKHPLGNRYTLKNKISGFQFGQVGAAAAAEPAGAPAAAGNPGSGTETSGAATNDPDGQNPAGLMAADGSSVCVVCMDAPFQTVFLECGHLACCVACSDKLKLCPICRNPIARVVPIFPAT